MSLFVTTPLYLFLLWPRETRGFTARSGSPPPWWRARVFYQNSGWLQFGFRFSLDYTPYLILFVVLGRRPFTRAFWALGLVGLLVNAWALRSSTGPADGRGGPSRRPARPPPSSVTKACSVEPSLSSSRSTRRVRRNKPRPRPLVAARRLVAACKRRSTGGQGVSLRAPPARGPASRTALLFSMSFLPRACPPILQLRCRRHRAVGHQEHSCRVPRVLPRVAPGPRAGPADRRLPAVAVHRDCLAHPAARCFRLRPLVSVSTAANARPPMGWTRSLRRSAPATVR